jgi:hypothetical protein
MQKQIKRVKKVRNYLLEQVKDLTIDQLNEIPEGLGNNIAWNMGHIIAAQQGICYTRAGLKPAVDEKFITLYKPGTRPGSFIDADEIASIKAAFVSALDQLEKDYENNLFTNYNAWTTRYGVAINDIDDAIEFLLFHEGYHSGCVAMLKNVISK